MFSSALYTDNGVIIMFTGILFLFVFVPVLLATFYICGSVHRSVSSPRLILVQSLFPPYLADLVGFGSVTRSDPLLDDKITEI